MIIIVALTFILSWSPFYLVSLVSQVQENSFLRHSNFLFTMLSTHLFGFINSSINPIVYHAMSDRFRRSFHDIWYRILTVLCCGSQRYLPQRQRNNTLSTSTWNGSRFESRSKSGTTMTTYCTNIAMDETVNDYPKQGQYSALTAKNGQRSSCISKL